MTHAEPAQRKNPLTRRLVAMAILGVSLLLWLIPSDVPQLIAKQRDVLLGRYSLDWMTALLILTPILWLIANGIARPSKRSGRQGVFRLATAVVASLVALTAADVICRHTISARYIEGKVQHRSSWPGDRVSDIVRHRPAQVNYKITYTDQPEQYRSYPDPPRGFGTMHFNLTTDKRGYRNQHALDKYDIVVLGDSFAEGSRVDDSEPWPVRLGEQTGWSVYNLGISGGKPSYYLSALRAYGLSLSPRMVICMIYEGNDFKVVRSGPSASDKGFWENAWDSPIRARLKRTLTNALGGINADAPVPYTEALSWIPAEVPTGSSIFYAIVPKRLTRLDQDPEKFAASRKWRDTSRVFGQLIDVCRKHGIQLVFAYAPTKPHVIMPLIRDSVSAGALHAFASYKQDNLPPPEKFKARLYERLNTQEHTVRSFCQNKGINFVSPTTALRQAMSKGEQVYYTYDQHWTTLGHAVVADVIHAHLAHPDHAAGFAVSDSSSTKQ